MRIKGLNRAGRVHAPDSKLTGEEPEWKDADIISVDQLNDRKNKGLRFYAYYCDNKFFKPIILNWMKANGYNKADLDIIQGAPMSYIPITSGKIIRMLDLGMPDKHWDDPNKTSNIAIAKKYIEDALRSIMLYSQNDLPKVIKKTNAPKLSAQAQLQIKIEKNILTELDIMLDQICELDVKKAKLKDIPKANMKSLLNGIPAKSSGPVIEWLERVHTEFWEAYEKRDDQLVEGYSWLTRPLLRRIVENFGQMLEDAKAHARIKEKGPRKPRVKKVIPPEKQVEKLKYQKEDKEFKIKSIDPTKIIGALRIYIFNTKYKQLTVLSSETPGGLKVKGSTIKEFNPGCSYSIKLRKPKEALEIIESKTPRQIETEFGKLKTKRYEAKGRSNDNVIILKALNKI